MNKKEKKALMLFGERDRFFTLKLLVDYLGITTEQERKDMIIRVIHTVSGFTSDADFLGCVKRLRKEVEDDASDEV